MIRRLSTEDADGCLDGTGAPSQHMRRGSSTRLAVGRPHPGHSRQTRVMTTDSHPARDTAGSGAERAAWDERYRASEQIWSGNPNGTLVTEIAHEPPGRALDVGCGEGADAIWLALRGWRVTALDVSEVALGRARKAADDAGVDIEWLHAGLLDAPIEPGRFDLVNAQYPALLRTPEHDAERALLAAVAPGGTLLMVHHADIQADHAEEHVFDPADYVVPADMLALLDDHWILQVNEPRPRDVRSGGGAHHILDRVLRARRLN